MIKITSNINQFAKAFKSYKDNFSKRLSEAIENVVDEFHNQLLKNINLALPYSEHEDDYSFMYDVVKEKTNDLQFKIKLGENSERITTDGNIVNPFYFFEFGFGVVGLGSFNNYDKALDFDLQWNYDVNLHGWAGWTYSYNGKKIWTQGIEGLHFLQDTINWFSINKDDVVKEAFKKAGLIK